MLIADTGALVTEHMTQALVANGATMQAAQQKAQQLSAQASSMLHEQIALAMPAGEISRPLANMMALKTAMDTVCTWALTQ